MKHLKTPQQLKEATENLNISDVSESNNDKRIVFSDFVIDLFKTKYQHLFNNNDENVIDNFEDECKEKAKQFGMDVDSLSMDGELLGFESDDDYKKSEKNFWWDYYGKDICVYSWI